MPHPATRVALQMMPPIALSGGPHKSFRQEMFDVCFAMFDVTMSSQRNWK